MSFESYYQKICKNGHYMSHDVYDPHDNKYCPICKEKFIWEHMVDETNGSYDDNGKRIDGYVNLKIKERITCKTCKHILETIYHIPKTKKK